MLFRSFVFAFHAPQTMLFKVLFVACAASVSGLVCPASMPACGSRIASSRMANVGMSAVVDEVMEKLKTMTLLEASELVKAIEETFDVDASAGGGGGMFSGIMGSVVSGMAMGTGSAVAHRAVDSMMGPRQVEHVHTGAPAPAAPAAAAPGMQCGNETQLFQDCIKNTGGDIAPCQSYMDMMMQCKAQFPSA